MGSARMVAMELVAQGFHQQRRIGAKRDLCVTAADDGVLKVVTDVKVHANFAKCRSIDFGHRDFKHHLLTAGNF